MDEKRIQVGDIVNVHFTTSTSIFRATVLHVPQGIGDCWQLAIRSIEPVNVQLFERMDLVRKGES